MGKTGRLELGDHVIFFRLFSREFARDPRVIIDCMPAIAPASHKKSGIYTVVQYII